MLEVLVLAIALSMDAFAVSVGLASRETNNTQTLALLSSIYFGFFQALMPLIGYFGGKGVFGWVESYTHWIAFFLLFLIGGKMIYESITGGIDDGIAQITHKVMLMLAIATSIDAMAAGFTLTLLEINPFIACAIIGVTTFLFSWVGVFVGTKSGVRLKSKAELLGGVILIVIGLRILLF